MLECKPENMTEAEMIDQWDIWDLFEELEAGRPEEAENSKEFRRCIFCGEKFPIKELNHRGECPDHDGETLLSDEEQEDQASLAEYYNKL